MKALPLPPARPWPRAFAAASIAYAAGVFALSSLPGSALPQRGMLTAFAYNLAHAPLFAGLALCVGSALVVQSGAATTTLPPRRAIACIAICLAYALFDELHQSFRSGRSPDAIDLATDLAGVGFAVVVLRRDAAPSARAAAVNAAAFCVAAVLCAWLAMRPFRPGVGA